MHNAALQRLGSFSDLTPADWHDSLAINLLAPVALSRCLLPELIASQGSIVHISSIHSQLTKEGFTAYATSKAALSGLTRALSVEIGSQVRVNAIEPAAIRTPMLEAGFADHPEQLAQLEAFHPTGSIGTPPGCRPSRELSDQSSPHLPQRLRVAARWRHPQPAARSGVTMASCQESHP